MFVTITAHSPCHWWRRFQASGAARWQQGCWTAWRRAAQWNQVQRVGKRSKSKHGRGPQMHQVQLLPPSTTPSVIRYSLALPSLLFCVRDGTHSRTGEKCCPRDVFEFNPSRGETTTNNMSIYKCKVIFATLHPKPIVISPRMTRGARCCKCSEHYLTSFSGNHILVRENGAQLRRTSSVKNQPCV